MDALNKPPTPPAPPAESSGTTMDKSSPPQKYVPPPFSASTEMILQRMKAGLTGGLPSIGITGTHPGYEEMRRNVVSAMKTTQNMQINTPPPRYQTSKKLTPKALAATPKSETPPGSVNNSGPKKRGKGASRAGQKRKRVKNDSESADESDALSGLGGDSDSDEKNAMSEMPKITQSGRQIVKPTQFVPTLPEASSRKRSSASANKRSQNQNQEQALCKRCGRGNSPHNNMIVFCDGCNLGWHQMCHDPIVSDEEVKDEESPWYCNDCARKRGIKQAPSKTDGVSWADKTIDQRRAYLSLLPHPQLVALLVKASTLHPDMPIFPANPLLPQSRQSQNTSRPTSNITQPFPPSTTFTAGLFSRAESNPNAPINFIRKIAPHAGLSNISPSPMFTTSFPPAPAFTHASSAPPTLPPQNKESNGNSNGISNGQELAQESRESTPNSPPYPKAGTGLMSKLGPDDEDIDWLVDNGDFEAFSHTVYDGEGKAAGGM
ncbi:hypothetical protein DSL72_003597 [Monilinia vaccinii-corymbosi]|uniref:PHD-type domain-containing protein n=1 Tax=Monilinia vaccinii-corymbosi TaxID=61207 RepID=A0A8A3P958_9HELO|nr:hypothetical protein DSL72_003597 [Monilinia vaccinii-corymbosi]